MSTLKTCDLSGDKGASVKTRRHHNNKGTRLMQRGHTVTQVKRMARKLHIPFAVAMDCPVCDGVGQLGSDECDICGGAGHIKELAGFQKSASS